MGEALINAQILRLAEEKDANRPDKCRNCRNFKMLSATKGECRINPPQLDLIQDGPQSFRRITNFPLTEPSDWCGQHKPNVEEQQ